MNDGIYLTQKELAHRYGIKVGAVKQWRARTRRGDPFGPPWIDDKTIFHPTAIRIKYRLADILAWEVSQGVTSINPPNQNG